MASPETPGGAARPGEAPLPTLKKRGEFLAMRSARKLAADGFVLQAKDRGGGSDVRVGYVCSRKVGNAVKRNRARRRLKEAARLALVPNARPGWDYVLIGRRDATAGIPFEDLLSDLRGALSRIHP